MYLDLYIGVVELVEFANTVSFGVKETEEMDARGNVLNVLAVSPALDYACRGVEPCTVSIVVHGAGGKIIGTEVMTAESLARLRQMEIEVFKYRKYLAIQRASKRPRTSSDFANEFIGVQPFPADVSRY